MTIVMKVILERIRALGKSEDIFIGITTSGNSPNIIKGVAAANAIGMKTFVLQESQVASLKGSQTVSIFRPKILPESKMPVLVGHIICGFVEKKCLVFLVV